MSIVLTPRSAAGPDASVGITAGYACRDSQGAVLVINSPARQQSIFENDLLWKYMLRHHHEWCEYARTTLGQRVRPQDVVLVTGWTKTSADWKAVAFTRSSMGYHAGLQGHALGFGAELRGARTRELEPPKMHREGVLYPRAHTDTTSSAEEAVSRTAAAPADSSSTSKSTALSSPNGQQKDQCMFLNRYMTKRRGLFKKIVAGAGPHRLPGQEDGKSERGEEGLMAVQEEESVDEDSMQNFEGEVSHKLRDIVTLVNGCH